MRPSRTSLLLARGALRSSASLCFFLTSSFTSASSSLSIVIESRTFFIRSYGITRNYKRTTMVSHPKKRPPRRLSTLGQEGVASMGELWCREKAVPLEGHATRLNIGSARHHHPLVYRAGLCPSG